MMERPIFRPKRRPAKTFVTIELTHEEHQRAKIASAAHRVSLREFCRQGVGFAIDHTFVPDESCVPVRGRPPTSKR